MNNDFWMFALTGLLLNLTPGNDMMYVIARSSGQGTKAGIISALGIGAGCIIHITAAVVGLSAIIASSALAFNIIRYAGASYLIYLGVKTLLKKKPSIVIKKVETISYRKIFWQGAATNVLNPKVALFFLAFLPQFVHVAHGHISLQILFLGIWFDLVGTLVNVMVAVLFGMIGAWLTKSRSFVRWQERITGIILIGLGIRVGIVK